MPVYALGSTQELVAVVEEVAVVRQIVDSNFEPSSLNGVQESRSDGVLFLGYELE